MRTILFSVVAVMALACTDSAPVRAVATSAAVTSESQGASVDEVVTDQQVPESLHGAIMHPTWTRTCGFANCSVYLNKRETRIASYGGALLTQLLCSILNGTAAKLACTGISYLVGRAGDNAVASNRCVKISFSRWTGVPYYIGTYGPSWRCV